MSAGRASPPARRQSAPLPVGVTMRMWRTGFVAVVLTLGVGAPALAQTGRITGRVTSAEGAIPIAAAQVIVAGTPARGAATNDSGRYTIELPAGTYTLRVARIGYTPDTLTGVVV